MAFYDPMTSINDFASQIDDLEKKIANRQLNPPQAGIFYDHLESIFTKTKQYEMDLKTRSNNFDQQMPRYLSAMREIYKKTIDLQMKLNEFFPMVESTSTGPLQSSSQGLTGVRSEQAKLSELENKLRSLELRLSACENLTDSRLSYLETSYFVNSGARGYSYNGLNRRRNEYYGNTGHRYGNGYDINLSPLHDHLDDTANDLHDSIYDLEDKFDEFKYKYERDQRNIQNKLDEIMTANRSQTQRQNNYCKCMTCDPINGRYQFCIRNNSQANNSTRQSYFNRNANPRSNYNSYYDPSYNYDNIFGSSFI
ncbi:uncharacterized protein LOC135843802 [Planococcus citri]|uniref:uncharacterized protein LOC135843802 n=1 Tax=Planococcus citri TaxID=170843 RepID=UPI0031FA34AB